MLYFCMPGDCVLHRYPGLEVGLAMNYWARSLLHYSLKLKKQPQNTFRNRETALDFFELTWKEVNRRPKKKTLIFKPTKRDVEDGSIQFYFRSTFFRGIIEFDVIVATWQAIQGKEPLLLGPSISVIYPKRPMALCWRIFWHHWVVKEGQENWPT